MRQPVFYHILYCNINSFVVQWWLWLLLNCQSFLWMNCYYNNVVSSISMTIISIIITLWAYYNYTGKLHIWHSLQKKPILCVHGIWNLTSIDDLWFELLNAGCALAPDCFSFTGSLYFKYYSVSGLKLMNNFPQFEL